MSLDNINLGFSELTQKFYLVRTSKNGEKVLEKKDVTVSVIALFISNATNFSDDSVYCMDDEYYRVVVDKVKESDIRREGSRLKIRRKNGCK
jgi:hypothetical protein